MTNNEKTFVGLGIVGALLAWMFASGEEKQEVSSEVNEEPKTLSGIDKKPNSFISRIKLPYYKFETFILDEVSYKGERVTLSFVSYWNGKKLFEGKDFSINSSLHRVSSLDTMVSLIGFLAIKPGDTDDEYFKDYTPFQHEWANSFDCEQLQILLYDYEDKNSEYYNKAKKELTKGFKTENLSGKKSKKKLSGRIPKTKQVWVMQSNYGQGWEDELHEDNLSEARQRIKEYRENAPQYSYRIKLKRVKL